MLRYRGGEMNEGDRRTTHRLDGTQRIAVSTAVLLKQPQPCLIKYRIRNIVELYMVIMPMRAIAL